MSLVGLLPALAADPALKRLTEAVASAGAASSDIVVADGLRPAMVAAAAKERPLLVVTSAERVAEDFMANLSSFFDPEEIAHFPAWETLPHERLSPRSDTVGKRVAVLRRLAHPTERIAEDQGPQSGPIRILVTPVRALLQPVVKGLGDLEPVLIEQGKAYDLDDVAQRLANAAYSRVDMVERRGEFAVRGGIVDVFGPEGDHPVRIEFFGDDVEEIRHFSVADQRSLPSTIDALWAPPVREILLTEAVRQRAASLKGTIPAVTEMLDKIAAGIAVEGMESLAPLLVDGMEPLLDVLPPDMGVVVLDPEKVATRAEDLRATSAEFLEASWAAASGGGQAPIDMDAASFVGFDEARELAQTQQRPWVTLGPFGLDASDADELAAQSITAYRGKITDAVADMKKWVAAGEAVVVTCPGKGSTSRFAEQFREAELPAVVVEQLDDAPALGAVSVTSAPLPHGFHSRACAIVLVTENDLLGKAGVASTRDMRKMPSKRRGQVDPLQLRPGDYVVHDQHGVGKFIEMVQRTVAGATREYLVLEYAPSKRGQPADRLFIPSDTLDQITKYVGGEAPSVSKLGGADWAKTKARARKAVREIAGELIRLYSARMASKGHRYGPDTPWQRELEEAFPYNETPDQLATIDEVKQDMEKDIPMDRLICGDVGYGKTEIAVRAAFKAIQEGKQVAVLVPTTILVSQHFDTFSERFANFPVTVRALSRFQSAKEAEETLRQLQTGDVDLVVGTHRLLGGSVRFKDLGMVIIDEEQRFGVEHKEALKRLRTNVDVLAMSATPIPRTLEMAVTGIREMSTLTTPPEERHPVLTYVGAYDEKQITAVIRRELLREGQVFFVHNRVQSLEKQAQRIRELVPEARVGTAHGRMSESRLEEVIEGFWEKRYDVLVTTTIIETGLDIATANTLIVDRADAMGLSQLHQLRGRVGRGRERAYAYFLYPPEKTLTETSHDRLATIAQNTDLGSGMHIAMKDLEIRGAGNLLGGEQSGHIAGVGFDLYVRMVGEAVSEFRGDVPEEMGDVKVELPVDAHLPHSYIGHERLRLEAYTKLSGAKTHTDVADVRAEWEDRYGSLPEPVENLLAIAELRVVARMAGVSEIIVLGTRVKFAPVSLPESATLRLNRLYPGAVIKDANDYIMVPSPKTARVGGEPLRNKDVLNWAMHLLRTVVMGESPAESN